MKNTTPEIISLTPEQVELQNHIKADFDKTQAWVNENPETRWACGPSYDDETIRELSSEGVNNISEYEARCLADDIWELFKDINGVRPRHLDLYNMTLSELKEIHDGLVKQNDALSELREKNVNRGLEVQAEIKNGLFD